MEFIDEPLALQPKLNKNISELQLKTTFFFRRNVDQEVIPVEDPQNAWDYYTTRRPDFTYIGCSDGKIFLEGLKESRKIFLEEGLEKSQERLKRAIEEEIEVAKLNKTPPMRADIFGNGAQYLMQNMGKYGK